MRHDVRTPVDGATFILEAPENVPAIWGLGDQVAWAAGEPLIIAGPPGVGKTTLAQQLVAARCGVLDDLNVLGMVVSPDTTERRTLYIAADRPRQAARAFRRLVTERDKQRLSDSLLVWPGPLPFSVVKEPAQLAAWLSFHGVGTVVIDSLKDIAMPLSQDEVGSAVNLALQHVIALDIDVLALHHQRKASGENKKPTTLADVYGSAWITAGAGSVLLLWGQPGDPIVELSHLKQPALEVGPLAVIHDHLTGTSRLHEPVDLRAMVDAATNGGLTAADAARRLFAVTDPDRNQVERARRRLQALVAYGQAVRVEGDQPKDPVHFRPVERRLRDAA